MRMKGIEVSCTGSGLTASQLEKSMKTQTKQVYILTIKPALLPAERHKIEKALRKLGYKWLGGGINIDLSQCDISFQKMK